MPRNLRPPAVIDDEYFLVMYDRETEEYVLALRDGETFDLGEAPETMRYLRRLLGDNHFADRAVDMARNFFVAQVIPVQRRIVQVDLPFKINETELLFGTPRGRVLMEEVGHA